MFNLQCQCGKTTRYDGVADTVDKKYVICIDCKKINNIETKQSLTDDEWLDLPVDTRSKLKTIFDLLNSSKIQEQIDSFQKETDEYRRLFQEDLINAPLEEVIKSLSKYYIMNKHNMEERHMELFRVVGGALKYLYDVQQENEGSN